MILERPSEKKHPVVTSLFVQVNRMATTSLKCLQHLRWKRSCQSPALRTSSPVEQTRWGSKWKGFAVMPTCAFTRVQTWECTDSQCEGSHLGFGIQSMKVLLNSVILATVCQKKSPTSVISAAISFGAWWSNCITCCKSCLPLWKYRSIFLL